MTGLQVSTKCDLIVEPKVQVNQPSDMLTAGPSDGLQVRTNIDFLIECALPGQQLSDLHIAGPSDKPSG